MSNIIEYSLLLGYLRNDRKSMKNADKIEAILDKNGLYYNNDGGDDDTYNINIPFDTEDERDKFITDYSRYIEYYDTDYFEESIKNTNDIVEEASIYLPTFLS